MDFTCLIETLNNHGLDISNLESEAVGVLRAVMNDRPSDEQRKGDRGGKEFIFLSS